VTAWFSAFVAGLVFALGLGLAGMTQPAKVLAFLDVGGAWDPSLALVMLGAIAVHAPLARRILRRRRPLLAPVFGVPPPRSVDARLVLGAMVFGIGWGLAGLCPGPAVTLLASATPAVLVFVAAMVGGMAIVSALERRLAAPVRARITIVSGSGRSRAVPSVRPASVRRPRPRPSRAPAPSPD
jgi:uncharacterized membrane protein YedE/YeeE